ncbi:mCG127681, partial [Mus musculus]
ALPFERLPFRSMAFSVHRKGHSVRFYKVTLCLALPAPGNGSDLTLGPLVWGKSLQPGQLLLEVTKMRKWRPGELKSLSKTS